MLENIYSYLLKGVIALVLPGLFLVSENALSSTVFNNADTDNDGAIGPEEFRKHMTDTFFHADANRDGVLAGDELGILNPDRASSADKDGDGQLNLKEFLNSTHQDFHSADKNHDYQLTADEL